MTENNLQMEHVIIVDRCAKVEIKGLVFQKFVVPSAEQVDMQVKIVYFMFCCRLVAQFDSNSVALVYEIIR